MIAIRLNKDINPNWLLQKLQHEINEHRKCNTLENSILYIDIKTVSQTADELIPKLEHTLEKLDDRGNEVPEST
jgi:uncharacterized protein YihD (DUF1040 family)